MKEAEQEATVCAEGTSLEAPLAFTCTHRGAFYVQLPYTGTRGGFIGKTMEVSDLLSTLSAQGICHFRSYRRCTLLYAQTLRAAVLGQSLPDPSCRLLQRPSASSVPPESVLHIFGSQAHRSQWEFQELLPCSACKHLNPQSLTTSCRDGMVNAGL